MIISAESKHKVLFFRFFMSEENILQKTSDVVSGRENHKKNTGDKSQLNIMDLFPDMNNFTAYAVKKANRCHDLHPQRTVILIYKKKDSNRAISPVRPTNGPPPNTATEGH